MYFLFFNFSSSVLAKNSESLDSLGIPESFCEKAKMLAKEDALPDIFGFNESSCRIDAFWIMELSIIHWNDRELNGLIRIWKKHGLIDDPFYNEILEIREAGFINQSNDLISILKLLKIKRLLFQEESRKRIANNLSTSVISYRPEKYTERSEFIKDGKFLDQLLKGIDAVYLMPSKEFVKSKEELNNLLHTAFKKIFHSSIIESRSSIVFNKHWYFEIYTLGKFHKFRIDNWIESLERVGKLALNDDFYRIVSVNLKQLGAELDFKKAISIKSFPEIIDIPTAEYNKIISAYPTLKIFERRYFINFFDREDAGKAGGLVLELPYSRKESNSTCLKTNSFYLGDVDATNYYLKAKTKETFLTRLDYRRKKSFNISDDRYLEICDEVRNNLILDEYELIRMIPNYHLSIPIVGPVHMPTVGKGKNKFKTVFPRIANYFAPALDQWTVRADKVNSHGIFLNSKKEKYYIDWSRGHPALDIIKVIKKELDTDHKKVYLQRSLVNMDFMCFYLSKPQLRSLQSLAQSALPLLKD